MKRIRVLSAVVALLFVATVAQAQRGQDDRRGRQDQHSQAAPHAAPQAAPQNQQRSGGNWGAAQPRPSGIDRARVDQGRDNQFRDNQARADQARADQARAAEEQNHQAQQQEQIQRAQRTEDEARLQQREPEALASRAYDRDYRPGYDYRYNVGGVYRLTNQYGVDVLRDALNQGYEQGYRAGSIDRGSGAPANVQRALDFETDGFGYSGAYVPQSDYSYYFTEGFQRGYDDGYWNRSQYGTFTNGKAAILGAIALGILGVTMVH